MNNITKGKWRIFHQIGHFLRIAVSEGDRIAIIENRPTVTETHANAQLIIEAPRTKKEHTKMLELLETIKRDCYLDENINRGINNKIKALLIKIRKEQKSKGS